MKKTVSASALPAAIGPYSHAAWVENFLFCSGQLGANPESGDLAGADVESQTRQALANIKALLESQGLTVSSVVKSTVFLTDMGNFKAMNDEYAKCFGSEPPARSTVAVAALPKGALVEIEVTAHR